MAKQEISVTVDTVVISKRSSGKYILLIQRRKDPYKGSWALPGGFLEKEETLEAGAKRELEEETGLKISSLQEIGVFGTPGRDPRGRIISIAFYAETEGEHKVLGSDDAEEAKWFKLEDLRDLAFDHSEIIKAALKLIN